MPSEKGTFSAVNGPSIFFLYVCVRACVCVCLCFSYIGPTINTPELFIKQFRRDSNAYYYIQHICGKSGNMGTGEHMFGEHRYRGT